MRTPALVAPAAKVLTVLHIIDPSKPHVDSSDPTTGMTMCGMAMRLADQWQLLEQLPGERICPRCTGEGPGADGEQETLL